MKISIIGSNGKVGKQALQTLLQNDLIAGHQLTLIERNTNKAQGAINDIYSSLPLLFKRKASADNKEVILNISSQYAHISGSNLIVVCAAKWANPAIKAAYKKIDPSGRLVQSYVNHDLIKEIAQNVAYYCDDVPVIIVTNQSDMMTELFKEHSLNNKTLGMGGMIDSSRLRHLLAKNLNCAPQNLDNQNHMIGYHNKSMLALKSSIDKRISFDDLSVIESNVRNFGSNVSKLQKDQRYPNINTGSSVLPGVAIALTIGAYVGTTLPIEESFTTLPNEEFSNTLSLKTNGILSIPVSISKDSIRVVEYLNLNELEVQKLRKAQKEFYQDYQNLKQYIGIQSNPDSKRSLDI